MTPTRLIGDTAYGAAPMLAWLVEDKKIEPYIPSPMDRNRWCTGCAVSRGAPRHR